METRRIRSGAVISLFASFRKWSFFCCTCFLAAPFVFPEVVRPSQLKKRGAGLYAVNLLDDTSQINSRSIGLVDVRSFSMTHE